MVNALLQRRLQKNIEVSRYPLHSSKIFYVRFGLTQKNQKVKAVNPWRRTRYHRGILSMVHLALNSQNLLLTGMKGSVSRFNRCPFLRQRFKANKFLYPNFQLVFYISY